MNNKFFIVTLSSEGGKRNGAGHDKGGRPWRTTAAEYVSQPRGAGLE
ncbi:hypothetical protein [Rhodospirillum sp. A1_3_36]